MNVDGDTVHLFTPDEMPPMNGIIILTLSTFNLSGVVQDSSYILTVTVCNDVTCKTSTPEAFCK